MGILAVNIIQFRNSSKLQTLLSNIIANDRNFYLGVFYSQKIFCIIIVLNSDRWHRDMKKRERFQYHLINM